ncbi:MAG: hypothetical protein OJF49_001683 [Ktedonobacterales bacterium]|jgi:excisionase family DNA binding protein|nr:MAG: hypothetical protein OJF49_001683 [Ktedonobacterales bacterium]
MNEPKYTIEEVADIIGVKVATVENWVRRDIVRGYKLDGRIVIPCSEVDDYRPMAEASKALDPTPPTEEIVEAIQRGRRKWVWPTETEEKQ